MAENLTVDYTDANRRILDLRVTPLTVRRKLIRLCHGYGATGG